MIYVTHDQAEAMTMGDRIVVIRDGRVQQIASPHEIYTAPANAFVAGFLGSPPMNFVTCTIAANGEPARLTCPGGPDGTSLFEATLDGPAADAIGRTESGRSVLVGVRPEDIRTHPPADGSPAAAVHATVEVVEFLGDEQFVNLRAGTTALVARVEPDVRVSPDDECTFYLNLAKARFFDPETERALGPRAGEPGLTG